MFVAFAYIAAALVTSVTQPVLAVDYLGGWLPSPPKEQCVDICVNSKAAPYCLTNDPDCLAKKQRPGDFDYMVLEQLFIPQYCRDLLQGVDTTLSHQNVNKFPSGISCKKEAAKSELTIHGLWPNYNNGYAGCCNVTETIINHPYDAAKFAKKYPNLLNVMKKRWIDPTQANEYDTLCEIYNHEFQKHGVCYNAFGKNMEKAAVNYFRATLTVAKQIHSATKAINKAAATTKQITVDEIKKLYSKKVMVFCSAVDGSNQLSVIRTCWDKPAKLTDEGPFVQRDCADPKANSMFTPCDATTPVTLDPYVVQAEAF